MLFFLILNLLLLGGPADGFWLSHAQEKYIDQCQDRLVS